MALRGTQLSTFAWHQTCVTGKFFFQDWGKPWGRADVSAGVPTGLDTRVFSKSNVRRVYYRPAEKKVRMEAVRLVRGDVDLLVVVAYMWPGLLCVRSRKESQTLVLLGLYH